MTPATSNKLSPLKWIAGVLVLVLVMVMCGGLGIWMSGHSAANRPMPVGGFAPFIVFITLGVIVACLGGALYAIALVTHAFTFRFDRPYFSTWGAKMWVINMIVTLLLQTGFAFFCMPSVASILDRFLPTAFTGIASLFIPFVAAQIVFVWLSIWAPLEVSTIRARMIGLGVTEADLQRGIPIGISNPSKSSFKKLTLVEEDMGMLWFGPEELTYRGDRQSWQIKREDLIDVVRKADAGSTSSYFGASHVILVYRDEQGTEHRVRLHPEGNWTQTSRARALDNLADRLNAWRGERVLEASRDRT